MSDVIAAISTALAPSAVGILRLSGQGCAQVAEQVFRLKNGKRLSQAPDRTLLLGTLYDTQGRILDQALAVYTRAPHTYTGEDTLELQCHGSPAVLTAGLSALLRAGARQAGPGEFTKRAFLNGKLDLTGAEAVIDLIEAQSADMAANAAAQVGGALAARIDPIYEGLADICSHYHAVLDYPDEDIPDFALEDFRQALSRDVKALTRLYDTCERGRILKSGARIVLLGRPNAGKSSLLNALAGYERVIVTDIPGTTRDTVEETVRFGKVLARLVDTAGIRDAGDRIEAMGVERSRVAAKGADLAIFVCDAAQPLTEEDRAAMDSAGLAKYAVAVLNKSDLPQRVFRVELPFEEVFSLSAKDGTGLEALSAFIQRRFATDLPCDGGILTNTRQAEAVYRARSALLRALGAMDRGVTPDAVLLELEEAMTALGELTGRTVREDITARIFERFCVGK